MLNYISRFIFFNQQIIFFQKTCYTESSSQSDVDKRSGAMVTFIKYKLDYPVSYDLPGDPCEPEIMYPLDPHMCTNFNADCNIYLMFYLNKITSWLYARFSLLGKHLVTYKLHC